MNDLIIGILVLLGSFFIDFAINLVEKDLDYLKKNLPEEKIEEIKIEEDQDKETKISNINIIEQIKKKFEYLKKLNIFLLLVIFFISLFLK